ncbi:hypothetical protein EXW57_27655 (plasmid) [Bacillus mycoides]|uniref:hypothetical protein n=1 Tax=Bacillus mycoides TaxID=1405 RepID=UPI001C031A6F|nr:hypothetical protein [Bacillus mycoides]QWI63518.1 hypothetical protein EXW57_27655 [Bacillus mycoides]
MFRKYLGIISMYIVLFVKKHYRITFSKKMRYMSDEFSYLNISLCKILSKMLALLDTIFRCILPITVFLCPIVYKYVLFAILFVLYLFKMKELRIVNFKSLIHKIFIKDAFFEFYGMLFISLNLILLFDLRILFIFLLLFISSYFKNNIFKVFLFVMYISVYLFPIFKINNDVKEFTFIILNFVILISICFVYVYKNKFNRKNLDLYTTKNMSLIYFEMQRLIRKLFDTKAKLINFLFPPYIILYIGIYYVLNKFLVFNNQEIFNSLLLVIYCGIYYVYVKRSIFAFDDCFYFSTTKLEVNSFNIIYKYIIKIFVLISFNMFNIFWGTSYLIILLKIELNFKTVGLLLFIHIFMLLIFISSNIYVDKNKADVTRYPEDIRKYMSLIEAYFLFILFILGHFLVYISFDNRLNNKLISDFSLIELDMYIISFIVLLGAVLSVLKTINYMWIVKRSIKRRQNR